MSKDLVQNAEVLLLLKRCNNSIITTYHMQSFYMRKIWRQRCFILHFPISCSYSSLLSALNHDDMVAMSGLDLYILRIVRSARLEVVRCFLERSIK